MSLNRTTRRASWPRARAIVLLSLAAACATRREAIEPGAAELAAERPDVVAGELGRRLDAYLSGAAGFGFDGVVAVEEGGELALLRAYGVADRRTGAATTVDTLYALGSLSKSYTAALVLALAADGALPLDATLGELVGGVPDDKAPITVEELMTHTAGLDYHEDDASARAATGSRDAFLRALLAQPSIAAPGERFAYSNVGYTVLALLCERAGGAPFEELLRERVLRPRGLRETALRGTSELSALPIARSWMDGAGQGTPREWPATSGDLGAGGVVATASDVLAWLRSLTPEQVEPRATVRGPVGYGAGWFTARTLRGTRVVYHAGDYMGFNSEARWYPDEDRRLVLLCNVRQSGVGLREPVLHRVALIASGEEVPAPPRVVTADPRRAAELAGRYASADGLELVVEPADGGIRVSADAPELARLLSSSEAPPAFAENAARLMTGALKGRFELARELLHAAVVRHEPTTVLEDAWRVADRQAGGITAFEVLGHVARGASGCGSSWARVDGPAGSAVLEIAWMNERLLGVGVSERGPSLELRALGGDAFASYDLFQDARVDVAFGADGVLELSGPLGSSALRPVGAAAAEAARAR